MAAAPMLNLRRDPEAAQIVELVREMKAIRIGYQIELKNGAPGPWVGARDKDVVGKSIEEGVCAYVSSQIAAFVKGPNPGASPDAVNSTYAYELKAFWAKGQPGFDLANFDSLVCNAAKDGGVRQLLETLYLIVAYDWDAESGTATFESVWLLPIWALPLYSGKYPLSLQSKRQTWYNLRPGVTSGWRDADRTPQRFIAALCKAVDECPNKGIVEKKDSLIASITSQFAALKTDPQD